MAHLVSARALLCLPESYRIQHKFKLLLSLAHALLVDATGNPNRESPCSQDWHLPGRTEPFSGIAVDDKCFPRLCGPWIPPSQLTYSANCSHLLVVFWRCVHALRSDALCPSPNSQFLWEQASSLHQFPVPPSCSSLALLIFKHIKDVPTSEHLHVLSLCLK